MPQAKLVIKDEVNVRFKAVDPETIAVMQERLTYHVPGFIHMPAYKLGRWDGKIRLFQKTGFTYLNLVEVVAPILENEGYDVHIEDERNWVDDISPQLSYIDENFLADAGIEKDGKPLVLWDHQVAAVNAGIENGQGILELATGSGKTLICGVMSKLWQPHGRVVVIVPNIDLVVQTQHWFKQIGVESGIWYGEIKERQQTTVATWQSLDHFPELFNEVKCVIVDEVHQAKAKVLSEMLAGPAAQVPFRFGCTGTLPKEDLFRMQIKGTIGDPIFVLRSYELQEKGILADANIYQMVLNDSDNPAWQRASAQHEDWRDELNWMFADQQRLAYMATTIEMVAEEQGNTLVLVQYRKHGKALAELLPNAVSLDGRDKGRMEHYKRFNDTNNNIMICTYGIASTGIDIPRIFNLVIIEPGKKFEKVMQTLGRGLRTAEDKRHLNVYDICGDDGLSKKHSATRRTLYREARQKLEKINLEYYDAGIDG